MISFLVCNRMENERKEMEFYAHFLAGRLSDEKWQFHVFRTDGEVKKFLAGEPVCDIACIDITIPDGIAIAEKIRSMNRHTFIILVATAQLSPLRYMKPTIMAGSLLLRVFSKEQLRQVFNEAFQSYLGAFESEEEKEDVYIVESREGRRLIPYSSIFYFEAREKKIAIGGRSDEVLCYDTIADLEQRLPDFFIRCHRSFIINRKRVVRLMLSQGIVLLEDNITIPVSRNYKAALKEIVPGKNQKL